MKKYFIGGGFIFLLLVIFVLVYYKSDNKPVMEEGTKAPEPPAPTAVDNQSPLDPNEGEGKAAIVSYAKSLFRDKKKMEELKRGEGLIGNVFSSVSPSKVGVLLSNKVLSPLGLSDSYGLNIVPPMIDNGNFLDKLKSFTQYSKYPRNKIDALGTDSFGKEFIAKGNFDTAGFRLVPTDSKDSIVQNDKGYSKCDQLISKKREECRKDNWEDFGRQLHLVGLQLIADTEKLDRILFDYSAQKLVNSGWKIIGYFPEA